MLRGNSAGSEEGHGSGRGIEEQQSRSEVCVAVRGVLDSGKCQHSSARGPCLSSPATLCALPSHDNFLPHSSTITSLGVILHATQI